MGGTPPVARARSLPLGLLWPAGDAAAALRLLPPVMLCFERDACAGPSAAAPAPPDADVGEGRDDEPGPLLLACERARPEQQQQ